MAAVLAAVAVYGIGFLWLFCAANKSELAMAVCSLGVGLQLLALGRLLWLVFA